MWISKLFSSSWPILLVVSACASPSQNNNEDPQSLHLKERSGGDTTIYNTSRDSFSQPAANLSISRQDLFFLGNALFNQTWVAAPASVKGQDGLGPTFNANSCSSCHFKDGRGRPPLDSSEPMLSMLIRLSVPGVDTHGGPKPEPNYGGQFNPSGIIGVLGEGKAVVEYQEIAGEFSDGEPYSLRKPSYKFTELNFGSLHPETMVSPRTAPALIGLGLLELVDEATILSFADADDQNKDGVRGRANYVFDAQSQKTVLGRFGWKANQPNLSQQNAGAFLGDMGITSSLFPNEDCPLVQQKCKHAPSGDSPEVSDAKRNAIDFYVRTLAVPARRHVADHTIQKGQALFEQAQCTSCHRPSLRTGISSEIPELSNQTIYPYTDLLVHDMGEELSDHRPDFQAHGADWRTPPLWGIGLVQTVNRHTYFLHDGRARNLKEAVLWHSGEAKNSRDTFIKMAKTDREALLQFIESL